MGQIITNQDFLIHCFVIMQQEWVSKGYTYDRWNHEFVYVLVRIKPLANGQGFGHYETEVEVKDMDPIPFSSREEIILEDRGRNPGCVELGITIEFMWCFPNSGVVRFGVHVDLPVESKTFQKQYSKWSRVPRLNLPPVQWRDFIFRMLSDFEPDPSRIPPPLQDSGPPTIVPNISNPRSPTAPGFKYWIMKYLYHPLGRVEFLCEVPKLRLDPIQDQPVRIKSCSRCVLFRSRRRNSRCSCVRPNIPHLLRHMEDTGYYVLDVEHVHSPHGSYKLYRRAILEQLETNQDFFIDCFRTLHSSGMDCDQVFLYALIEIQAEGDKTNRCPKGEVRVSVAEPRVFNRDEFGQGEEASASGWRDHLRRCGFKSIGVTFEFEVHHPNDLEVSFKLHAEIPVLEKDLKPRGNISAKSLAREIHNTFSDHEITEELGEYPDPTKPDPRLQPSRPGSHQRLFYSPPSTPRQSRPPLADPQGHKRVLPGSGSAKQRGDHRTTKSRHVKFAATTNSK